MWSKAGMIPVKLCIQKGDEMLNQDPRSYLMIAEKTTLEGGT